MCLATGEASGANLYGVLRFEPNLTTARVITISIGLSSSRRLIVNRGDAGPRLAVLAHDRAVANRLALGKKVVNVACVGIDYDRAWRLLSPFVASSISKVFLRRKTPRAVVGPQGLSCAAPITGLANRDPSKC